MLGTLALAALVGIPLAQVPLVVYLSRLVELDSDERRPRAERGYVTYGTASARPGSETGAPVCPHCGHTLDDGYDYCGACAGRLPPAWTRR
ncbi:MAG: hypothetical protein ABEJ73_00405 [Haloplanus sp.]